MTTIRKERDEIVHIDLLTNLSGEFFPDEDYATESGEFLDGGELAEFEDVITDQVKKSDRGKPCNFMNYFHGSKEIRQKVESAIVSVKNIDGVLYGCTSLQMKEYLDGEELKELTDYITGQYADGWGESFEQRELAVEGGTLRVHFYQAKDSYFLDQIVKADISENVTLPVRPKLKLLGHDGNIFSIMADARHLLIKNGQGEITKEMIRRVENSGDYYKALSIISEYVDTELSMPDEKKSPDRKKQKGKGECR